MADQARADQFVVHAPSVELLERVPLAGRTTLGVGGPARFFTKADSEPRLADALAWCERRGVTAYLLGGGSNLVVADEGVDGLVLEIGLRGLDFEERGSEVLVTAAAGEPWDEFVALTVQRGLSGLECLSGIPGRVGATPIQNVGAYGCEVGETIESVRVFDRTTRATRSLAGSECRFGYRDSLFKSQEPGRFVVLAVRFRLSKQAGGAVRYPELSKELAARGAGSPTLEQVRDAVLALRRAKSMLLDPSDENRRSCGSFFVNPLVSAEHAERVVAAAGGEPVPRYPQPDGRIKLSAGWLIERAGLPKGTRRGPVGLSTRHALCLVCHEGARASDVVAFSREIRERVAARFDVELAPEPVFWGVTA